MIMVSEQGNRKEFCHRSICLFALLLCVPVTSAGSVLVILFPAFSHVQPVIPALEELHNKYGHTSTLIMTEHLLAKSQLANTSIQYIVSDNLNELKGENLMKDALRLSLDGEYTLLPKLLKFFPKFCNLLLSDQKVISAIQEKSFDLILMQQTPSALCLNVLAYNLSIPFMYYGLLYDPNNDRIPYVPSFIPAHPFAKYTDHMKFHQRVINSLIFLIQMLLPDMTSPSNLFEIYAPQKPPISTSELWKQSCFHLYDMDVLIDYPRPIMPNMALVGGLGTRPARPLTGEFKSFMDSADKGAVIVSFGSAVTELKQQIVDKFITAFRKIDHFKFVFKYGKSVVREKNLLIMPWIPQNDLLGHKNTKLFITHCGNGGQFEALYHGVQILGFPLIGDQMYNAIRMESKGFGIIMDILNFEVEDLVKNVHLMLENPKYANAIKLASEIFHSRPHPKEVAAYWIDHVMKYGGSYMRSASLDLPLYQYLLLDVIVFLFLLFMFFIAIGFFLFKRCRKCLCRKQKTKKID